MRQAFDLAWFYLVAGEHNHLIERRSLLIQVAKEDPASVESTSKLNALVGELGAPQRTRDYS